MSLTLAKPKTQSEKSGADSAPRVAAAEVETAAPGGLPLFLQNGGGRIQKLSAAGGGDADELEADRIAQAASKSRPKADASGAKTPARLSPSMRGAIEPVLGSDLSGVKVHSGPDAHAAADRLNARAFTTGRDIVLGKGARADDVGLMAHEATHVVQQARNGPAVQRQPKTPDTCQQPPGKYNFIPPQPAPVAPGKVPSEVKVAATDPRTGKATTQTVTLEEPVTMLEPIVFYAIPIELTDIGEKKCDVPASTPAQPDPNKDKQPALWLPPGYILAPIPMNVSIEGQPILTERITAAYVITSQYHHLAVGAGATTVLKTAQGFRLIDAGVGTDGGSDVSDAIMDRLDGILKGEPIVEVMITHLHADHTNLLPRIAEKFQIGKLRTSAAQFADPRFQQLLRDVAESQARGVADRAKAEFDTKRADWDAREGSKVGDVKQRERAYETAKETYAREAVIKARGNPTTVELFVPEAGALRVVSAPLGTLPDLTAATTDPVTQGLRRVGAPGDISDTAFVDPKSGKILKDQQDRLKSDPNARIDNDEVDTASTNFIVDLPGGNRLIVVPDVRTSDLKRPAVDATEQKAANLVRELVDLGFTKAKYTAWNMTHHMQSGWVEGGAPHIAGTAQIDGFIALIHDVRAAQGGNQPGKAGPADLISVSAQHDIATRTMVNPAMGWFLESLGFKVLLAANGRDVRLIEAITAGGQRIAGVSGLAYSALKPSDPLLMESEAALRYMEAKIQDATTEPPPKRTKSPNYVSKKDKIAKLKKVRDAIKDARDALVKTASEALWVGVHDDKAAKPERAAELPKLEQALRDAMKVPDLSGFTPPKPGDLPVVSDTALVLMRIHGDQPVDTGAQKILESNQRADTLRAKIHSGEDVAENKAQLTAELEGLRTLINEKLPHSPDASQPVLKEELENIHKELDSLVHSPEGQVLYTREPGTGRVVENRVVRAPVSKATQRVQAGIDVANRVLGAVMVYQTIKGQDQLEEQAKQGSINKAQEVVGTVKNLQGFSMGLRMMASVEINPAEFVIMSVLDITQTALGDYDTREQKAVAISQSAIRAGITLFLMIVSQAMMRCGNPYVMIAGFALMFLVEPIMEFLDWLGLFDWIERKSAFLPDEVTGTSQHLRTLMKDYRVIIGDMQIAERSDEQIQKLGTGDTAGVRAAAQRDMTKYRESALEKETELLTEFGKAYKAVKEDFAGLFELDTLRSQFLAMREQVRRGDLAHDADTRKQALDKFAEIDKTLNLDQMTPEQIDGMPQWKKLKDGVDDFEGLLGKSEIDWEDVRKKEQDVEQMFRNARYRIDPGALGLRTDPLLSPGTAARTQYETRLQELELRMKGLVGLMSSAAITNSKSTNFALPAYGTTQSLVDGYKTMLDNAPLSAPEAGAVYRGTIPYERWVKDHDDYSAYLDRLRSMEIAMQAASTRQEVSDGLPLLGQSPPSGQLPVEAQIQSEISRRKDKMGYLFIDEYHQMYGQIQDNQAQRLALLLGQPADVKPLTDEEKDALDRGQMEDYQKTLTTVTNQLQGAKGLHIPDKPDEEVGGIKRVEGYVDEIDLFIISIERGKVDAEDNVLVAVVDEGHEELTGQGHLMAYNVVPVNAQGVSRLGPHGKMMRSTLLHPVYLRELLPKGQEAAAK